VFWYSIRKPPIGTTKKAFVDRCQTFLTQEPELTTTFNEIYDYRSAADHLHNWQTAFANVPSEQRELRAGFRVYQAELTTSFVYSRILSDDRLFQLFSDDSTIDQLWASQHHERNVAWGEKMTLSKASEQRYVPFMDFTRRIPGVF